MPTNWSRTSTQAISVPITTLTAVTSAAMPTVRRMAAAVCSLVIVSQNAVHPPSAGRDHDRGQRDEHEQAEPDHRDAEAEARDAGEPARAGGPGRPAPSAPAGPPSRDGGRGHSALPDAAMICVTIPVSSSKNLSDSSHQLPKSSSTVSRFVDLGERVGRVVGALDLAELDAVDRPGGSP